MHTTTQQKNQTAAEPGGKCGRNWSGWYIVLVSAIAGCGFAASFPQFSMTITDLSAATGLSPGLLMTSDTVKSAAIVLGMLLSGFAYNRFGARKIFLFSLIASAVPQFLIPHVHSATLLMLFKISQGLVALVFPVFLVIILRWMDEKEAGISTAVFNGIFFAGAGLGGTMAGIFITAYGWRSAYYALGFFQLLTGFLWLLTVNPVPPCAHREMPFDAAHCPKRARNRIVERHLGGAKSHIFERRPERANQRDLENAALECGHRQKPGKHTALDCGHDRKSYPAKKIVASPVLWLLAISLFATMWGVQAVTVDWAIFGEWLGYDAAALGKVMSAVTFGMLFSCVLSGKTSDFFARLTARKGAARIKVLLAGHGLIVATTGLLLLGDMRHFGLFYITTFLFTFAVSWGLGSFYCILPELYEERAVPLATGIIGGLGDLGLPAAPMVVGVLLGLRGFWQFGWMSCAAVALLSFAAGLLLLILIKR